MADTGARKPVAREKVGEKGKKKERTNTASMILAEEKKGNNSP